MTYRHIVLFRIHEHVADAEVSAAMDALRELGAASGAESWHVALSSDERKGRVVIEDASFASTEAFEAFRALDLHREVGARMARISDWWVGDYER